MYNHSPFLASLILALIINIPSGFSQFSSQALPGKHIALVISIEPDRLSFRNSPSKNAQSINILLQNYGFAPELLINPFRGDILQKIRVYQAKFYRPKDQLFIFIIGYSVYSEREKKGFLIANERELGQSIEDRRIELSYLANLIDQIPCEHILLFMDLCQSSHFYRPLSRRAFLPSPNDLTSFSQFLSRTQPLRSRLLISATNKNTLNEANNNWVLSSAFLDLLATKYALHKPTTFFLFYDRLEMIKPTPTLASFGMHQLGGDFYFLNPAALKPFSSNLSKQKQKQPHDKEDKQPNTISSFIYHTVKKGENLYRIGKRYQIPYVDIQKWNNMVSTDIYPGDELIVGMRMGSKR